MGHVHTQYRGTPLSIKRNVCQRAPRELSRTPQQKPRARLPREEAGAGEEGGAGPSAEEVSWPERGRARRPCMARFRMADVT